MCIRDRGEERIPNYKTAVAALEKAGHTVTTSGMLKKTITVRNQSGKEQTFQTEGAFVEWARNLFSD